MNLTSYVLEQALKRLHFSGETIEQFRLASASSDVEGEGFPAELFQLSVPLIVRGLLNYALLQVNRDWIYPYWIRRQLDPADVSFTSRAQNPLLINTTHRNWTMCGTLNGRHEAIVDPRGLITPLPREWSVDTWLALGDRVWFPSAMEEVHQDLEEGFPCLATSFRAGEVDLRNELFAGTTNHALDILFVNATLRNRGEDPARGLLCVALRPFNPEGVSPLRKVEFRTPNTLFVNDAIGIVFAEAVPWFSCGSAAAGDLGAMLRREKADLIAREKIAHATCDRGLAHALAVYPFDLPPGGERSVRYSIALAEEKQMVRHPVKQSWRVGYEKRRTAQRLLWRGELEGATSFVFPEERLRKIFDAQRLALLELHDRDFISPGPYLYHHFWFRDAVVMIRALDELGFHRRAREAIDAFPSRLRSDGFFRAPAGEWDSNGAVLWIVLRHYQASPSLPWLKKWYPLLEKGARWIVRKRGASANGLMPRSMSAEHLGTADQYFWDSFWSLAGLRSMAETARILGKEQAYRQWSGEARSLEEACLRAFREIEARLGNPLIPAGPSREFDESGIGSICCLHPLMLFDPGLPHPGATVRTLREKYVDERGFYHPIFHSGYNTYLTMQIAHSLLLLGERDEAWRVAETILSRMESPWSLPEAIHPRTGGGAMGDGHHGWAAAEIILFLVHWNERREN